jgi:hypothetical protein
MEQEYELPSSKQADGVQRFDAKSGTRAIKYGLLDPVNLKASVDELYAYRSRLARNENHVCILSLSSS